MPGSGHFALIRKKRAVIHPDSGHFVHKDQRPLKGVIYIFIQWIGDEAALSLQPARLQVIIPQLVGARELLQGAFVDYINAVLRGALFVIDVALPVLDRKGVSQYFFFIR